MKKCVKDLIAGAVLALCSIGYYVASHSIQSFGSNKDFISARTIPVAWAVLLLVLSVVLMVRGYAEIRHLKAMWSLSASTRRFPRATLRIWRVQLSCMG